MRSRFCIVLSLVFAGPLAALAADPVVGTPVPGSAPVDVQPAVVAPPVPVVNEKPKPLEKPKPVEKPRPVEPPKPVEKPKPIEKPRPVVNNAPPAELSPVKPAEPPATATPTTTPPAGADNAGGQAASTGYSFACWALSFAMLILGVAIGFVWRHLMSRHKLGGMTVRIGTWRGIP